MDYLPQDPAILVSSVNMLLRDEEYDSLEDLCNAFDRDIEELKATLSEQGFVYVEQQKQFRPKAQWNMKRIINPWLNRPEYNCFGCCPSNPIGLHLQFYEDGEYIVSSWKPGTHYQGWVNTLHGGILSTLIDEVCGWVVTRKLQTSGYTVQLNVKFRKAVSTDEPELTIRAKVAKQVRNLAYIHAEITNSKGEVCNEGEAIYFLMNQEKAREMGFLECEVEK